MRKEAFIYSWSTEDEESAHKKGFHIRMYGMDEEDRNVCLHVRGFMPYFYVEMEGLLEREVWSVRGGVARQVLRLLDARHTQDECEEGGCKECWSGRMTFVRGLKKLYFHHEDTCCMIKMEFPNNLRRKRAYYKLQEKTIQFGGDRTTTLLIHENEANPVLQFCTQRHIDTAGWVAWDKEDKSPVATLKQTTCHREVSRSWEAVHPLEDKDKPSPTPHVLSFDIEVYSSVPTRMPDATIRDDVVFQASMVFTRDQKEFKSYLLSLGKPSRSVVGKNVVLRTFATEKELLLGFVEVLRQEEPNAVIGYNIFGFDLVYMIARAKMWGIMDRFDQVGFRVRDRSGRAVHAPEKTVSWTSSAYSHQNFCFLDAEGRLFVDLLPVVRRDYKFENYRLKTVSEFFIGETKDPIKPKDIFEGHRLSMRGDHALLSRVGKYCVQDSRLVLLLFEKLQTWIGLTEMAKTCRVPMLSLYTQGQQVKVFSQLYYLCTHDGIAVQSPHSLGKNRAHIEGADHYSGAYVFPPVPGVYDWVVPFDFCLAGDTLVSLANGTSRRIDQLAHDTMVLAGSDGFEPCSSTHGLQVKGVREVVRVVLRNGRSLVATPDHKVMLENGAWCPAKDLAGKKVRCGVVFTQDATCQDEDKWSLSVGGQIFSMRDRDRALALARVLGYTLPGNGPRALETRIDATAFEEDVGRINNENVVERLLDGCHGVPAFLLEESCPRSMVREFLGGLYGRLGSVGDDGSVRLAWEMLTRFVGKCVMALHERLLGVVGQLGDAGTHLRHIGFRFRINQSCRLDVAAVGGSVPGEAVVVGPNDARLPHYTQEVVGVEAHEPTEVFDIEVEDAHNFIAGSLLVSNCSLYPSCIITYNIDFSTLVIDPSVPDEKCHVIRWWDHIGCEHDKTVHATKPTQVVCQEFCFRFLKEPTGVIPRLLNSLLSARASTRKLMKQVGAKRREDGSDKAAMDLLMRVYDKRQLAYKVSANSVYGAMGVKKGYLPFLPGAMSTTAMGRHSIQTAAKHVREKLSGQIVYGDTDSIYCHFPLQLDAAGLWEHAKRVEEELMSVFPKPMKLAFEEKIYKKFFILTKKRYMALTCDGQGKDDAKLTIRGVLLARRDNAKWVRSIYEQVVRSVMAGVKYEQLVSHVNGEVLSLMRGGATAPFKPFTISKTLGKDYVVRAPPTDPVKRRKRLEELGVREESGWEEEYRLRSQPAHAQLAARMKARGCVVEPGSRIEFVVAQHANPNAKLADRTEDPSYATEHSDLVRVDPLYYAQNLINPLDQVVEVCFKKKKVVEKIVETHTRFRTLMAELTWHHAPHEFHEQDGTVQHHPSVVAFVRHQKKKEKKQAKKTKSTTTKTTTKKKKKKDDVSIADMLQDVLQKK